MRFPTKWRSLMALTVAVGLCAGLPTRAMAAAAPTAPTATDGSKRAQVGPYTVVWLKGTPYEMGRQHGLLLHAELKEAHDAIMWNPALRLMLLLAQGQGLIELAKRNTYPDMMDEIQGFLDATKDQGWTLPECMALNFGDVLVERVRHGGSMTPPGCSQFVASGAATKDGRLYHGRLLDWAKIDFVINHPVIFVKQPTDGIAHAVIGFPGNLSPYSGINAAGLSICSNEATPRDGSPAETAGHSHVQMLERILKTCHSLKEAQALIAGEHHLSTEIFAIADGNTREASIFEMTPHHLGQRPLRDGIVFTTNHFVAPETAAYDQKPIEPSSLRRFQRMGELLSPGVPQSLYGKLDPAAMIGVMRDRIDPWTDKACAADEFDDSSSLATNGALYAILFDPEARRFWVAAGKVPIPAQSFIGFSLPELLTGVVPTQPAVIP